MRQISIILPRCKNMNNFKFVRKTYVDTNKHSKKQDALIQLFLLFYENNRKLARLESLYHLVIHQWKSSHFNDKGLVQNSQLLFSYFTFPRLSEWYADCYDEINNVFEDWFENLLISNMLKQRQVVIVMNNEKYQSR